MRKVRIGNDINVRWEVKTDGQAVSLEGKALKLYVRSAYRKEEITTFTVEGCVVSFTYPASMQRMTGARAVILEDATEGAPRRTVCADQAFTLVAHSCEENDDDVEFEDFMVSLQSNVLIGKPGLSAYEVWLSEGNTGTQEDWYAYLQKPATDVAAEVTKAETARVEAEKQRVEAETARQDNEAARQEAEEGRAEAELKRTDAEQKRADAELLRKNAETKREQAEQARLGDENLRKTAEENRASAETGRSDAEQRRDANETSREAAEQMRKSDEADRIRDEKEREEAETSRKAAEELRETAENQRYDAEQERHQHEDAREDSEGKRDTAETLRKQAETGRDNAEQERKTSEQTRKDSESSRVAAEKERTASEQTRKENETARVNAESGRDEKETERKTAEQERKTSEQERKIAEQGRVSAETARQSAETKREQAAKDNKTATDNAVAAANAATSAAKTATDKANTAAMEAENVNVSLNDATISITNRKGDTKTVEVMTYTDETVNVSITSAVNDLNAGGIKINVYLNNGKTPQTYTTNNDGKVSFVVNRGNYYQIVFPEYGNAQPISPVGYTAVLTSRNINVEYKPYEEDMTEKVVVTVKKYTDNVGTVWEGIPVTITYDGKDTVLNTDSNGQVNTFIPLGKEYTVKVEDTDGYYVNFYRNTRTYKAFLSERSITYNLYQYRTGIFVLDANGGQYTIDEWTAAGKTQDEAVAIKIADINLCINKATFAIRTSDLKIPSNIPAKAYCLQKVLFESIISDGANINNPNYYNGLKESFLVLQEALERNISVPAFEYTNAQTLTITGEELRGFIGSVGQIDIFINNKITFQDVVTKLYSRDIFTKFWKYIRDNAVWTSGQSGQNYAYGFYQDQLRTADKTSTGRAVLSFFNC